MVMLRLVIILFISFVGFSAGYAQSKDSDDEPVFDSYQIYLKKPAEEIKEILNYKDCQPIKGTITEDKKKVIMEDYVPGNKVYLQVRYADGTEEEFVRSPCFIDPVIL
jgi:hypothetical protein